MSSDGGDVAASNATRTVNQALWPALQGGSVGMASGIPGADVLDLRSLMSCTPKSRAALLSSKGSANRQGGTTERVDIAVGLAFERLWHERPMGGPDACGSKDVHVENGDVVGAVDGFITHYFRRVAELSRESVYQSHQRDILSRMRDDLAAGDRTGSLNELEEMIQKVNLDDRSLQTEIAALMQIANGSDLVERNPRSLGVGGCCCGTDGNRENAGIMGPCSSVREDRRKDGSCSTSAGSVADSASARTVPPCDDCLTQ